MPTDPLLRLTVEDVFEIRGRGTVVTGNIERGAVQVGDEVDVSGPSGVRRATVAGVEKSRKVLDRAEAGDSVGLLLRGLGKADVHRGDVIAAPGAPPPRCVPPETRTPQALLCPRCAAPLDVAPGADLVTCRYCSTTVRL